MAALADDELRLDRIEPGRHLWQRKVIFRYGGRSHCLLLLASSLRSYDAFRSAVAAEGGPLIADRWYIAEPMGWAFAIVRASGFQVTEADEQ